MFFYVIYGQPFELDDSASCGSRSSSTSGHRGLTVDPCHLVNPDPIQARHRLPPGELHRFPLPPFDFVSVDCRTTAPQLLVAAPRGRAPLGPWPRPGPAQARSPHHDRASTTLGPRPGPAQARSQHRDRALS